MEISIIVPAYNAEAYIAACLSSVEEIREIDYECIVIDDGSQDHTWKIMKGFAERNRRFIVKHIEHGGVSKARNVGLGLAAGDKILFLDADDYLLPSASEVLRRALNFPEDILVISHETVINGNVIRRYEYPDISNLSYREAVAELTIGQQHLNNSWAKILSRRIIAQNQIEFDRKMRIGEDAKFILEYLQAASSIRIVNEALQAYVINHAGTMRSSDLSALEDEIKVYHTRIETLKKLGIQETEDVRKALNSSYFVKLAGYMCKDSKKNGLFKFYRNIQRYMSNAWVQDILNNLSRETLPQKHKMLLRLLRARSYWALSIILKIYTC